MWHKNCFALLIARWLALSTHAVYKWNPNTSFILWKHVIPCVIFFGLSNLFERLCCTRGVLRWSDALTTEYVLTNSHSYYTSYAVRSNYCVVQSFQCHAVVMKWIGILHPGKNANTHTTTTTTAIISRIRFSRHIHRTSVQLSYL